MKKILFVAVLLSLMAAGIVNATANTVNALPNTENCSVTILSSAMLDSSANVTRNFQWLTRINLTSANQNDTQTCRLNYTAWTYTTTFDTTSTTPNYILINGTAGSNIIPLTGNSTDADSRQRINFTVTIKANQSLIFNFTFNMSNTMTLQGNVSQRLANQKIFRINNLGEVNVSNIWSIYGAYVSTWQKSVKVYECTDALCGNTIGTSGVSAAKTELSGAAVGNNTAQSVIQWRDTSLANGTITYYAVEGSDALTGWVEEEDNAPVTTTTGSVETVPFSGSSPSVREASIFGIPRTVALLFIIFIIILAIAIVWAIKR